jgi:methyl coenzyme M reductase alpha subunit
MSKWFAANRLALNLDETNIIKFTANNYPQHALNTGYNGKCTE